MLVRLSTTAERALLCASVLLTERGLLLLLLPLC
jgi:hypothetical protein